jgi:hypothetical protein
MLIFPIIFNATSDDCSLGVPEHQPSSCVVLNGKQVQLLAYGTVVAALGLLDTLLVDLQLR